MSVSSRVRLHQEKMIIAAVFIFIAAIVSVLAFRNHQQSEQAANKLPDQAPLSVTIGDSSLTNKLVVYTDPVCDKCAQYHDETLTKVYDDYVKPKKLKLEIRPLSIVSEQSAALTELLMCSNEQGKYWETSNMVYHAVGRKNNKGLEFNAAAFFVDFPSSKVAEIVNMDGKKLSSCLNDDRYKEKIKQADQQAYAANVYSTPTTFIGTQEPVRGMAIYPFIKSLIDISI